MKSKEYLEELRRAPGLVRVVLRKIEVEKNVITFRLVTDVTYSPQDVEYARGVSQKYVPQGFFCGCTRDEIGAGQGGRAQGGRPDPERPFPGRGGVCRPRGHRRGDRRRGRKVLCLRRPARARAHDGRRRSGRRERRTRQEFLRNVVRRSALHRQGARGDRTGSASRGGIHRRAPFLSHRAL